MNLAGRIEHDLNEPLFLIEARHTVHFSLWIRAGEGVVVELGCRGLMLLSLFWSSRMVLVENTFTQHIMSVLALRTTHTECLAGFLILRISRSAADLEIRIGS